MGLELIRERVEELGGSVQVDTAPLRGTTVRVTM
jgi:signal transduction histidine kinase